MGTNESWIAVKVGSAADIARIEKDIVASYEARKAKLLHRDHDPSLEHMAELGRGAKLGVAIVAGKIGKDGGWVSIVDSQVGTSDAHLARSIAKKLRTTVFRYAEIDAANFHGIERLGPSMPASTRTGGCPGYHDLTKKDGARYLCFAKVTDEAYDAGAVDGLEIKCKECGYPGEWTPGYDVPAAPLARDLVPIHGKADTKSGRVLLIVKCPHCSETVGYGTMRLDDGLFVDGKLLGKAPKSLDGFDVVIASQRAAIEKDLPLPSTLVAKAKAEKLASAIRESPRAALERALAALRLKARPKKPPPLALAFAPTKGDILRAIETSARGFDMRPHDLPGKLDLQLVSWLGPKPKVKAVGGFLDSIKKLLVEGSFARHGRDRKTGEWLTAVAFPLPDATWAALLMFETFATSTG